MKRGADRDMASPHKRARNLGQEIRVLIPSRVRAIPNLIVRLKNLNDHFSISINHFSLVFYRLLDP